MGLKQAKKKYSEKELEELKLVGIKLKNKLILDSMKEHPRATYDEVVEGLIKIYNASPHEALGVGAQRAFNQEKKRRDKS